MNSLTCQAQCTPRATSLPAGADAERGALEDHLACCDSCSCLMDQLRSTVADAQVLRPDNDLVTTEAYGAVDAALAELDPLDAGLVTLIDGAPLSLVKCNATLLQLTANCSPNVSMSGESIKRAEWK